jgi:hypothetical protein
MVDMCRNRWGTATLLLLVLVAGPVAAQTGPWSFKLAGGYATPMSTYGDVLNGGWQGQIGVGYSPGSGRAGLTLEYNRSWNDVDDAFLRGLGIQDGQSRFWSVTLNGVVRMGSGNIQPYLIGGGGWYHRTVDFYGGTVAVPVVDPWWGTIGVVPAQTVLGSVGDDAVGVNGGLGLLFRLGDEGSAVFLEGRYHYAWTDAVDSEVLPVVLGFAYRY